MAVKSWGQIKWPSYNSLDFGLRARCGFLQKESSVTPKRCWHSWNEQDKGNIQLPNPLQSNTGEVLGKQAENSCLKPYGRDRKRILLESRMIPRMVYGMKGCTWWLRWCWHQKAPVRGRFGNVAVTLIDCSVFDVGLFPINQRCVFFLFFPPLNSLTVSVFAPSCTKSGCSSVSKLLLLFCSRPAPV